MVGPRQRAALGLESGRMHPVSLPSSAPHEGLEPTSSSVRCAPAFGCGSGPALGWLQAVRDILVMQRWEPVTGAG
jgi:hypothetical protein